MDRDILHLSIPAFPIALARAVDGALAGRPVAVAPGNSERALVQCVSSEATAEGVFPGLPLFRARRVCPSLTIIPPDPLLLARGTRLLGELSAEFSPLVEPAAGRVFLDLTGTGRLFGPARDVAGRLERRISRRMGLNAMAGTAANKLVSRVAADALPEPGVYDVYRGAEASFLAPFPVGVLPGVGGEREARLLRDLNLKLVQELAGLSVAQLRLAVGPFAPLLLERARGIDRSPVQPPRVSREIVEESFLEREENDDDILLAELLRLVEGCGARLRNSGRGTDRLVLTIWYADGVSESGQKRLPAPESLDIPLFRAAESLFLATCRRRVRVRSLRLACVPAAEKHGQLELFAQPAADTRRHEALQQALDGVRGKYGTGSLAWGRSLAAAPARSVGEAPAAGEADLSEYRYHTLTKRGG